MDKPSSQAWAAAARIRALNIQTADVLISLFSQSEEERFKCELSITTRIAEIIEDAIRSKPTESRKLEVNVNGKLYIADVTNDMTIRLLKKVALEKADYTTLTDSWIVQTLEGAVFGDDELLGDYKDQLAVVPR